MPSESQLHPPSRQPSPGRPTRRSSRITRPTWKVMEGVPQTYTPRQRLRTISKRQVTPKKSQRGQSNTNEVIASGAVGMTLGEFRDADGDIRLLSVEELGSLSAEILAEYNRQLKMACIEDAKEAERFRRWCKGEE